MPKIIYQDQLGNSKEIEVEKGLSVMEGAIQNDIPGIDADCGGAMACATCHVYVEEKWFDKLVKAEDVEVDMIDMAHEPKKNSRLSCQIIVSDKALVTTPIDKLFPIISNIIYLLLVRFGIGLLICISPLIVYLPQVDLYHSLRPQNFP